MWMRVQHVSACMCECVSHRVFEGGRLQLCGGDLCTICPGNEAVRTKYTRNDKEDKSWSSERKRESECVCVYL